MDHYRSSSPTHDAVIVGGGVAGASLAIALSRAGWSVAVIEREAIFRDRVRGEGIHPWGYREAIALGFDPVLTAAGANRLYFWQQYANREPVEATRWDDDPENPLPEIGISHVRLQNASLAVAEMTGATIIRPAAARELYRDGKGIWHVTVDQGRGVTSVITGRLLVGADGRYSGVRSKLGISVTTDPEHHRFGGMLVDGMPLAANAMHTVYFPGGFSYMMPQGDGRARIYLGAARSIVEPIASVRSGAALLDFLRDWYPEGTFDPVRAAGPMVFFPNGDIVPDQIAAEHAVLIGDAAGANDPSTGQGLSQVYRDVRELAELLLHDRSQQSLDQFARQRAARHAIVREFARWIGALVIETGPEADLRRSGMRRAKLADPTQNGFAYIYSRGPFNLDISPEGKAAYFGETPKPRARKSG